MTHEDVANCPIPEGYRFAGVPCGLKRSGKRDLTVVVADQPATAAGVYTRNKVCAAPVIIDRNLTPSNRVRAVVINSGNANACTGEQGMADAVAMQSHTAESIGCEADQVLVMSTGVIGVPLDMECIRTGIADATGALSNSASSFHHAAEGILTTDTCTKTAGIAMELDGRTVSLAALAKGSGMIAPNMATMLGLVVTDASLTTEEAQTVLSRTTDKTFNRITVDGHMSTNDTVLLLARSSAQPSSSAALDQFEAALVAVCDQLARAIVDDGEGATHRIDIEVTGCQNNDDAAEIALAIGNSPLVKTAIAGGDPNWGRIVSAAGYAGPDFDPNVAKLTVNGHLLFDRGVPVPFDDPAVSKSMRDAQTVSIHLSCGEGSGGARVQSADLTSEYVRINADYRT